MSPNVALFPEGFEVRDHANFLVTGQLAIGGQDQPGSIDVRLPDGTYKATWTAAGKTLWKGSQSHTLHNHGYVTFGGTGEAGEYIFRFACHWQYARFEAHDGCEFTLTKIGPFVDPPVKPVSLFRRLWRRAA